MKNTLTKKLGSLLGILVVALIGVTFASTSAHALLAAGTAIDNAATVSYDEGADVTSNTVTTTVNLVSGLAWDDPSLAPVTQSTGSASGLPLAYTVDLVNLSNGATTAAVSDGTTQSTPANLTAGTWTINGGASPASVPLGGTVTSDVGVYDGTTNTDIPISNGAVAGLVAGDTVRVGGIGGTDYVIVSISATSIELPGDLSATFAAAGVQIGEVSTVTFNGTTGTLSNTTSESHNHSMTATDDVGGGLNADGNAAATDTVSSDTDGGGGTAWQTFVTAGVLSIQKYVRNADDPTDNAAGTTTPVDVDATSPYGTSHFQSDVTGDTGETLEYLIIVTNAGPGDATNVSVQDVISQYLSFTAGTVNIDADGDGTFEIVDAEGVADAAIYDGTDTLDVYPGVGGVASTTTGGTVAFDALPETAFIFQVVIQ